MIKMTKNESECYEYGLISLLMDNVWINEKLLVKLYQLEYIIDYWYVIQERQLFLQPFALSTSA